MARIEGTDVASVAYAGAPFPYAGAYTMVPIKLFNPRFLIPNHHWHYDMIWRNSSMAIRNAIPGASLLSPLYNEPICFNVKSHIATKVSPDGRRMVL